MPEGQKLKGPSDGFVITVTRRPGQFYTAQYVGGSGDDAIYGIANATAEGFIVAGDTTSPDFTGASFQPALRGPSDGFLANVRHSGGIGSWTYLGGSGSDGIRSLAATQDGSLVVTGSTSSADFPVTPGAAQTGYGGGASDAFVAKLDPGATSVTWATYLGGNGDDRGLGGAVEFRNGNVVVTGSTSSSNFPVTGQARRIPEPNTTDVFVTKLIHTGQSHLFSLLFGGSASDTGAAVAVTSASDVLSSVWVAGTTWSSDFPFLELSRPAPPDGFVLKLDSDCTALLSAHPATAPASGGSVSFGFKVPSDCVWKASRETGASHLIITSASEGAGEGTLTVQAAPNTGAARVGQVWVNGLGVAIRQAAADAPPCTYSLNPAAIHKVHPLGGGQHIDVTQPHCGCTATPGADWIEVDRTCRDGKVTISVSSNPSRIQRFGTVDISGQTFRISQLAGGPLRRQAVGVFSPAGAWRLDADSSFSAQTGHDLIFQWGSAGWKPLVGDWNADGHTEVGAFAGGKWYLDVNGDLRLNAGDLVFAWGDEGSTPVPGDWNGDGVTDAGVWKNGAWILDLNGNRRLDPGEIFAWGPADATPVTGDWNHDGRTKVGVFREGYWTLDIDGNRAFNPAEDQHFHFGNPDMMPVVGDWNADGRTKVGVMKDGIWILDINGSATFDEPDAHFVWGNPGSVPVVGEWDFYGVTSVGVFEIVDGAGMFTIDLDGNREFRPPIDRQFRFGGPGDIPVVGRWAHGVWH